MSLSLCSRLVQLVMLFVVHGWASYCCGGRAARASVWDNFSEGGAAASMRCWRAIMSVVLYVWCRGTGVQHPVRNKQNTLGHSRQLKLLQPLVATRVNVFLFSIVYSSDIDTAWL